VEGYAGPLWKVGEYRNKVLSLAKGGNLEANLRTPASDRRSTRKTGLGNTLRRWHSDPRPPARRGWKKRGESEEKLGRSRGGFSTKIHIRCEGTGKPITFILSPGQRNESIFLEQLMEQGSVKRSGRGRPRLRPLRLVGDKGYTGRRIRNYLRRRGIRLTIPRLSNESRRGPFSREIYRQRNVVERAINRLKQFRRIATRYEKLATNYTAMITIACILLWL
jgi:transposase